MRRQVVTSPSGVIWGRDVRGARILIVDDEPVNVLLLERILEHEGFTNIVSTTDSRRTVELCLQAPTDMVLLDLMMPHLNGFGVLEKLREALGTDEFLPVIILTADTDRQNRIRALEAGAADFLIKPIDAVEVAYRVRNLLYTRLQHVDLRTQNQGLEERVNERTASLVRLNRELEESQIESLERLAQAAEFRDDDTGEHTRRVGITASLLASLLGYDAEQVALIRRAAPLHDVGKIGIPDAILLKPTRLTPEEFAIMQTHAIIGARLLQNGRSPQTRYAEIIARTHHERWDGNGYPNKLRENDIPLEGRIVAVADVFDALTHARPYKKAWSITEALDEIRRQTGTQFDPQVVDAFLSLPHAELI